MGQLGAQTATAWDAKSRGTTVVDVSTVLDDGEFSRPQKFVVLFACLAIVFDGFDGQLASFVIPLLIREWGVPREAFATVVAAGLVGMAIGSAVAGYFGDAIGRRKAAIGSVALFSIGTMAMALAQDVTSLACLRFIAGLGVGGALPTATTLAAEYSPARLRTVAITTTIVFVPVGGMLAGLFASATLPVLGWRYFFLIGGALPLALCILLGKFLLESPRWLAHRPGRWPELHDLLGKMGHAVPAGASFRDAATSNTQDRLRVSALFTDGRGLSSGLLWIIFFMSLMAVYMAFSWLPTLLAAEGHSVAIAASGLTAYNTGGVVGAIICALAIARFGSRWPMLLFAAVGLGTAALLSAYSNLLSAPILIALIGAHGLAVIAIQCVLFALCAHIYPTTVRATGTAAALTFGRFGAILSAFVGAGVIGAAGGLSGAFGILAFAMGIAFIALAVLPKHINGAKSA